jgi:hypothetical protein
MRKLIDSPLGFLALVLLVNVAHSGVDWLAAYVQ